jgi:RNA polymerase sigma factor (TIGR02999 family)
VVRPRIGWHLSRQGTSPGTSPAAPLQQCSRVAAAAGAETDRDPTALTGACGTGWSGPPVERFEIHIRSARGLGLAPTHDEPTPILESVSGFAERLRDARGDENSESPALRHRASLCMSRSWARIAGPGRCELESRVSGLFAAAERGEANAAGALFTALYSELHRLASRQLARGAAGATLGTTSLLHEAYLDLSRREGVSFPDRARFLGYAARVMRGLIIDAARRRQAVKRGGEFEITGLDGHEVASDEPSRQLAALGEALDGLARIDAALAELVDLKFFCGFSFGEIAELRGVTERTVQRHWEKARLYLHDALDPDSGD